MRLISLSIFLLLAGAGHAPNPGILLLAHGGSPEWNERVAAVAASANKTTPTELALGMAARSSIQAAASRLVARGVDRIVAVPLFISSHSSVVTSTQYLLGLRKEMPPDLIAFAKMKSHDHAAGESMADMDGTTPLKLPVPVEMTAALDAHPLVTAIVADRAAAISRDPAREIVVLVAHGPVDDATNDQWLSNLRIIGRDLMRARGYRAVDAITVRDDAPAAIRDAATAELRSLVQSRAKTGRVLIVPVLLSFGGIEAGLRQRLEGLEYSLATAGLAPDDRLVDWVLEMGRQNVAR